mgnify:CR=1 FL=1
MVYLFVILALLCLAVKGFCGKKTSIYAEKISYAFLLNLVRMLLCIVVGLIVLLIESGGRITGIDWRLALISLTGGAGTAMLVVCWVLAIRENTLVKVDVACTVASLLPAILSLIFFKENPELHEPKDKKKKITGTKNPNRPSVRKKVHEKKLAEERKTAARRKAERNFRRSRDI